MKESKKALKGVSFKINENTVTGFLGANGAGKTTTIKCILNLIYPTEGSIRYFNQDKFNTEVKSKIGFLPERPYFYEYLTGVEFLEFYGKISGRVTSKDLYSRINYLLKKVDLMHAKDRPLRSYSKGMLQKIGLAQALIHYPELAILDEPMAGLDPDGRHYLSELIKDTAKEGTAVFFSSHLLNDTEKLCNSLVILREGDLAFEGTMDSFLDDLGGSYELTYRENNGDQKKIASNSSEAQSMIDQLRAESKEIISVQRKKTSLEEAFVKLALKGRS